MIYITGNTHGDGKRFETEQTRKMTAEDFLIVCGDFGFIWNGSKKEEKQLDKLSQKPYTILFVDGTHENFDLLNAYPVKPWRQGRVHQIRSNILHLMRGEIFDIDGHSFFAFGGGETEEKEVYLETGKWWPQEMPTRQEMIDGAKHLFDRSLTVDYILTHEPCPNHAVMGVTKELHRSALQSFFEEILAQVTYKQWFFGAQHTDRNINGRHIAVFEQILPLHPPVTVEKHGKYAKKTRRKGQTA